MGSIAIRAGDMIVSRKGKGITGSFCELDGEPFYRIENVDGLRPFLISIVSDSDHWMFVSSNGALSAGRREPDLALFPYCTDDKIHDSQEITGSKTVMIVEGGDACHLWEPFSLRQNGQFDITRNLYKGLYGTRLRFEEINHDLHLRFSYEWRSSEQYGLVKRAFIASDRSDRVSIRLLDGIQNVMPSGVGSRLQNERSTLVDAYRKGELYPEAGLGIFSLSSIPVDRPEPAEALKATTVFSLGLRARSYLLSSGQLDAFRAGAELQPETDIRGERGAFFFHADVGLDAGEKRSWLIVAEVDQGPAEAADLAMDLAQQRIGVDDVERDVAEGIRRLKALAAVSDAIQRTSDPVSDARHYANVLFNIMRGGVFENAYQVDRTDFIDFVRTQNVAIHERYWERLTQLPPSVHLADLRKELLEANDLQLMRLCDEYLPLSFSRRHGDPSRPWNQFSIRTRKGNGSRDRYFEGNWRDIFQNWEALAYSYPEFVPNMIAKFLNASTIDGYNPYRITRDGIDWETADPNDEWSHIGYWGDHQLIYLLKLLEISAAHHPEWLGKQLNQRRFSYANVPYRIGTYESMLADPRATIEFDAVRDAAIQQRAGEIGADGKLIADERGEILLAGLGEKLLVSVLAKMANFIPGAGIWMNTQRPEWNDANNALVGYGVSVVTLCYMRRFLTFAKALFARQQAVEVSEEVADLFAAVRAALVQYEPYLEEQITDARRKIILDALGQAGSAYRETCYGKGFSGQSSTLSSSDLDSFFSVAVAWIDHTIRSNRRPDGLFHAYNLIKINDDESISVERLYEMLEGQVAVLSSGFLDLDEGIDLLDSLRNSSLFREDQYSYILYPDRELPRFLDKNNLPADRVEKTGLITRLLGEGDDRLVVRDSSGAYHFNGSFRNAEDVATVLDDLAASGYGTDVERDRETILQLFEDVFQHHFFTGRSGAFFGYEGLGSIYWHMVSKLLLATGEMFSAAYREGADLNHLRKLATLYYDIRKGLGQNKSPEEYGAFPMDPYSHTPGNGGARQPGMTGQVKEDILARWHELGISVQDGCVRFLPGLLRREEFFESGGEDFVFTDVEGDQQVLSLSEHSLVFTYCQVPVVYHSTGPFSVTVLVNGETKTFEDGVLDIQTSKELFGRTGTIKRIDVFVSQDMYPQ